MDGNLETGTIEILFTRKKEPPLLADGSFKIYSKFV
jgi:hypothetical protein